MNSSEYSLWRGGALVGRFNERSPMMHHGRRVGACGVLVPADGVEPLVGTMQTRIRTLPGAPTFQSPLERIDPHEPVARDARHEIVALKPLSESEARGVPAASVLEVRGPDGVVQDADLVMLQQIVMPTGAAVQLGLPVDWTSYWFVSFAVHTMDEGVP